MHSKRKYLYIIVLRKLFGINILGITLKLLSELSLFYCVYGQKMVHTDRNIPAINILIK